MKHLVCIAAAVSLLAMPFTARTASAEEADEAPGKQYVLLYSMTGYAQQGTKRALLRRLTESPAATPSAWTLFRLEDGLPLNQAREEATPLSGADYTAWLEAHKAGETQGVPAEEKRTFKCQNYSCDFSEVRENGVYVLQVLLSDGNSMLSKPFLISPKPLQEQVMRGLSISNAKARIAEEMSQGGYYDCNNIFGEAYSHGTYLSGLSNYAMLVADQLSQEDNEQLMWAAQQAFDYLMELYDPQSGEIRYCAPERPGDELSNSGIHNSVEAVIGLAAYMDAFAKADPSRVDNDHLDCILKTVDYIEQELVRIKDQYYVGEWKATVMSHLYRAFGREEFLEAALEAGEQVLQKYSFQHSYRGNAINRFEGLWLLSKLAPEFTQSQAYQDRIAEWREDAARILENSAYHFPTFFGAWDQMGDVHLGQSFDSRELWWVLNQNVEGLAMDACFLWDMTGDPAFEQIAAGALGYITGINFGVTKRMATVDDGAGGALVCASFIANTYGGVSPWTFWAFDVKDEGWASIVNGYTVEDSETASFVNRYTVETDDYVYSNRDWVWGETFIRMDGVMLFAGSLYENLVNAPGQ